MAKRGNHRGFVTARVNAQVEARQDIHDAELLAEDMTAYDYWTPLPSDCVNADGLCCPCCGGCYCTPVQKFAAQFNNKYRRVA